MNVLHYIPYIDSDVNSARHSFIDELLRTSVPGVVNSLLTRSKCVPAFSAYKLDNRLACIKSMLWFAIFGKKNFLQILKDSGAEIVYIHSVCDYTSLLVARWAASCRVPVVVSPYKELMPWHTANYGFFGRIAKMLIAHRIMKSGTAFIHAMSSQEASVLLKKFSTTLLNSFSKSNDRIAVITPVAKDEAGEEDIVRFSSSYSKLYRKMIDSNPFWLMSEDDCIVENGLLSLGCTITAGKDSADSFLPISDIREAASKLSDEHWRRIQLHCFDQEVYSYIRAAREMLTGESEDFDGIAVDRIPRTVRYTPLETNVPRIRKARMHQVTEDYERHEKEKQLCVMMLNIKYLYSHNLLTRRHLAELFVAVRYEDYDEYILESMLDDLNVLKFAARIIAVLSESMLLGAGYHPVPALDDRKCRRIKRKLFKSNIE